MDLVTPECRLATALGPARLPRQPAARVKRPRAPIRPYCRQARHPAGDMSTFAATPPRTTTGPEPVMRRVRSGGDIIIFFSARIKGLRLHVASRRPAPPRPRDGFLFTLMKRRRPLLLCCRDYLQFWSVSELVGDASVVRFAPPRFYFCSGSCNAAELVSNLNLD